MQIQTAIVQTGSTEQPLGQNVWIRLGAERQQGYLASSFSMTMHLTSQMVQEGTNLSLSPDICPL